MKKVLEAVGFTLALWGVVGLVHAWTGWFAPPGVVRALEFFDGYEVHAEVALIVLGGVVMVTADRIAARIPR
ncbi:hypothetical protein [Streptomyces sp. bgisy100]|uniref:hypothetical protein n=1 Tax=Streptomyces sp. bgisy100 TaxID=3413783 RepID=UPI003D741BF8